MALETPIWLEAVSGDLAINFSARQLRTIADAIWSAEGVVGVNDLTVSPRGVGANMSVDISAGMAVITGDAVANQGKYVMRSTAVENRTVGAAPASGSRTDLVVAQLYDKQADGGSTYGWSILVLPGTTTTPPSAIELGRITVAAGTTSITAASITSTTKRYAAVGTARYPVYSQQASQPDFNSSPQSPTVNNFSSANWAPLTFVMPPSGRVFISVSADLFSEQADPNTFTEVSWTLTAGLLIVGTGRSIAGSGIKVNLGRRTLVTGPAGLSVTVTPQFRFIGSNEWTSIDKGMLIVEFV